MNQLTSADMKAIRKSLLYDNSVEEVDDMLSDANIEKDSTGVTITYRNGVVDRFQYVPVLMHESDVPSD